MMRLLQATVTWAPMAEQVNIQWSELVNFNHTSCWENCAAKKNHQKTPKTPNSYFLLNNKY